MKFKFKKLSSYDISLFCVIILTTLYLTILTLRLFNVFAFNLPQHFSYIFAYILVILCLGLYICEFGIEKFKKLYIPNWIKILFNIAFFLFTNVYYICGLYQSLLTEFVFVCYISFLISIIALAIYFNLNKDENNKLKKSTKVLIFNVFIYEIAFSSIFILLKSSIIKLFIPYYVFATFGYLILDFVVEIATCLVISILFALSHKKDKKFLNNCLIKFND